MPDAPPPSQPPPSQPPRSSSPRPSAQATLPPADPLARPGVPPTWRDALPRLSLPSLPAAPAQLLAAAVAVAGVAVAVVVAVVALRGAPAAAPPLVLPRAAPALDPAAAPVAATATGTEPGRTSAAAANGPGAYVHAAGAVARPGVYRVRAGGRVSDLLDAAGGPAPDADVDQVNLAAKVTDGERVYVPRRGEAPPPAAGSSTSGASGASGSAGPVNLNTATLDQLDALPGVGPATAQAILEYRQTHGRFRAVDELLEVRGIGEAKLAALRPKVRV